MPRSFGTAGIRRRHGAPICLIAGKTLRQLNDEDFAEFARALADAPNAGHHSWVHNSARAFSLHQACCELRICQDSPRMARRGPRARGGDLRLDASVETSHSAGRDAARGISRQHRRRRRFAWSVVT